MRKTLLFVLIISFASPVCGDAAAQNRKENETFTVVIDPGHGGKQPGAVSGKLYEKDINLSIALKFGKLISDNLPDVKVLYTRTDDRAVGLAERGAFANKNSADLFISIHINALDNTAANGTSTWVMGVEKNKQSLEEAMRENEAIKYEEGGSEAYEGFDPSSAESYIIFQIMQYAHFDRSLQFARTLQKHYGKSTTMRDRGAEQGPFLVLWKAAMPAVLTEIGFISNESDRNYISSAKGQDAIAKSLYDAFCEYKISVKGGATQTPAPAATPAPKSATTTAAQPKPAGASPAGFYVQLFATRSRVPLNDVRFGAYRGKAVERVVNGLYKYSLGPYSTRGEAAGVQGEVRKQKEFKDAFIIEL